MLDHSDVLLPVGKKMWIGNLLGGSNVLDGFIDELRLTAVCRSTDSYVVDVEPFPRG
jgi:hypothetical protein